MANLDPFQFQYNNGVLSTGGFSSELNVAQPGTNNPFEHVGSISPKGLHDDPSSWGGFGPPIKVDGVSVSKTATSGINFDSIAGYIGAGTNILGTVMDYLGSNKAAKASAAAYRSQANLASQMADVYTMSANAYSGSAKSAIATGLANARNLRLSASMLDRYEQLKLWESNKEARRRVGTGRAGFAANGVLVDSGSAAMWEQDEAADAAIERLDIMQQFEDQGWTYRTQANQAEAARYAQAAQYYGSAAQEAGNAYSSALQSAEYTRQSINASKQKKKGLGGVIGSVGGAIIGGVLGGPVGASIGASLGGIGGGFVKA